MLTRHTFLRSTLAAGVAALALAGCGQMRPSQSMDVYEAALSARQEVPPGTGAGTGMAEVQYNSNTGVISWKVTYSGLSGPATAAHIHGPAAAGANAGVVVPFTNVGAQPVVGQATITPTQYGDLAAGLWYVNIHTAAAPGGEIRGQLRRRQ
ncbi:MAG: CHRD domain-containing protein [Ramlibacter sp.]